MSRKFNCSFVMDASEFDSIDFFFGAEIEDIETEYVLLKSYPEEGELINGDIQFELTDEEIDSLPNGFVIEAKLNNLDEEDGIIKVYSRRIYKDQNVLEGSLIVDSYQDTKIDFYLKKEALLKYDYDKSFHKPSLNGNILEGDKNFHETGFEGGNWYYIDDYKANNKVPHKEGFAFIEWFTDESLTNIYTEDTGLAYAYFVKQEVFACKIQRNTLNASLRFISTITQPMLEHLNSMGFRFNGVLGEQTIEDYDVTDISLYRKLYIDGTQVTPQQVGYPEESVYFMVFTWSDIDFSVQPCIFSIKPFVDMLDSTRVLVSDTFYLWMLDENTNIIEKTNDVENLIIFNKRKEYQSGDGMNINTENNEISLKIDNSIYNLATINPISKSLQVDSRTIGNDEGMRKSLADSNYSNALQPALVAGNNINIAADGKTISAVDTTYAAGNGININNGVISATGGGGNGESYTAGNGINISSNNEIDIQLQDDTYNLLKFNHFTNNLELEAHSLGWNEEVREFLADSESANNALQTQITNENKLSADLLSDGNINKPSVWNAMTNNSYIQLYAGNSDPVEGRIAAVGEYSNMKKGDLYVNTGNLSTYYLITSVMNDFATCKPIGLETIIEGDWSPPRTKNDYNGKYIPNGTIWVDSDGYTAYIKIGDKYENSVQVFKWVEVVEKKNINSMEAQIYEKFVPINGICFEEEWNNTSNSNYIDISDVHYLQINNCKIHIVSRAYMQKPLTIRFYLNGVLKQTVSNLSAIYPSEEIDVSDYDSITFSIPDLDYGIVSYTKIYDKNMWQTLIDKDNKLDNQLVDNTYSLLANISVENQTPSISVWTSNNNEDQYDDILLKATLQTNNQYGTGVNLGIYTDNGGSTFSTLNIANNTSRPYCYKFERETEDIWQITKTGQFIDDSHYQEIDFDTISSNELTLSDKITNVNLTVSNSNTNFVQGTTIKLYGRKKF